MQTEIPRNAREKSPELHRAIESVTEPLYPFGLEETEREGTEEMLTMSRIDEIRRAYFEEGKTISGISAEYALDRKTVRKYVMKEDFNAVVPSAGREAMQPKLDPYKKTIDEWLEGDMKARRKQRHTAKRVYDRLVETHAGFDCSYRTVAAYVGSRRKSLYATDRAALPLVHKAGEAQADFGSADFYLNGKLYDGNYLNVSFPYSNAGYLQLFKGENAECLFEGLTTIFVRLGGIPPRIWFDNASTLVAAVLKGGARDLTQGFLRFKEHHGFIAAFCNPNAGHEKGNVENKVGYHRRNLLVPVPEFVDLDAYNRTLLDRSVEDHGRAHYRFDGSIAQRHEEDRKALLPLPAAAYDCAGYERRRVDAWGKIRLTPAHVYSTAPKYAGATILVRKTANDVIPLDGSHRAITVHKRLYGSGKQEAMDWLPYLTQLSRNPGALKYTGIREMLPDPLRRYLDGLERAEQGKVLKVLANLSERDGFDKAVESVAEAVRRNLPDLDSLVTLHDYLHRLHAPDRMNLEATKLSALPELPGFSFPVELCDAMLTNRTAGTC